MGTYQRSVAALLLSASLLGTIAPARAVKSSSIALDAAVRGRDVSVVVAARGATLYEHEGAKRRTPASVQKLLLSMALFDSLGPKHRLATRIMSTTRKGVVDNLWVVGGGDPTMVTGWGDAAHTGVGRIARRIERSGIRKVRGAVLVDGSAIGNDWDAPGWQPWSRDFAARPTALALNGNRSADPTIAFGRALTSALERRGVAVDGQPRFGRAPRNARRIATVRSASLRDLVTHMNVTSSNFYAETLGKVLGAHTFGAPGTMAKGARAIERFATRRGVSVRAHDSSGLSYANRVSASGVVTLLGRARLRSWGAALRRSLPRPGRGTLAGRLAGLPVRAKTGTLWSGASALAGWVELRGGARAEFAILSRHVPKSLEDALVRVAAGMRAPAKPRRCGGSTSVAVTRCQLSRWWEEIGPPARTPE
ncbi:MAG: D-alanyl-D-alanine carboxypeptidase/D-alanyl-D-alanine-endopeptidase [Actinomycetota bacterium]